MEKTSILITAVSAVALTTLLGFMMIPWLRRLKFGQVFNEIGPTWHQKKSGTPTMGGLMIICGVVLSLATGFITYILKQPQIMNDQYRQERFRLYMSVIIALMFGLIGFVDDMMKIKNHQNLGLTAKKKLIPQVAIAVFYLFVMVKFGGATTEWIFPFIGKVQLGWFYYPLSVFTIVGFVNAVNLTDGLDGLSSSVTFFYSLSMIIVSAVLGYVSTGLFATAIAGACIGFLVWNFYPAKVFMGDTGSMFLGGAVVAMAFGISYPVLLFLSGIVYLCEAFSDILQIGYFKLTHGKRIFKMAPIHHHFELSGLSEIQIALLFSAVTICGGFLSFLCARAV